MKLKSYRIPNDDEVRDLWDRYARTRSAAARRAVAEAYVPLLHSVVMKLWPSLPHNVVDRDELVGVGAVGLMQAVERYDGTRGVKFYAFATPRIRGAIMDWLRREDRIPRGRRDRINAADAARDLFAAEHGRPPTPQELAGVMGITVGKVAEIERAVRHATAGDEEVEQAHQTREPAPDHRAEVADEVAAALPDFSPCCVAIMRATVEGNGRQADVAARFGLTLRQARVRLGHYRARFKKQRLQACGA